MIEAHVAALQKKCEHIDYRIHEEMAHPAWDEQRVRQLKEQRLHIKDEIERLQHMDDERH